MARSDTSDTQSDLARNQVESQYESAFVQQLREIAEEQERAASRSGQAEITLTTDPTPPPDDLKQLETPGILKDLGTQFVGGVRDAAVETVQTIESAGDYLRENFETIKAVDDFFGGKIQFQAPEIAKSDTFVGGAVRGITQFITGMAFPAAKLKALGTISRGAISGFVSDSTAFDPDEANLSATINQLAEANQDAEGFFKQLPVFMQGTITDALANNPSDSELEKRLKKGLEGVLIGIPFDALFTAIRVYKATKQAKKLGAEDAAAQVGADLKKGELSSSDLSVRKTEIESSIASAKKEARRFQSELNNLVKSGGDPQAELELFTSKTKALDEVKSLQDELKGLSSAAKIPGGTGPGAGKKTVQSSEIPPQQKDLYDAPDQVDGLSRQFVEPVEITVGGKKHKLDLDAFGDLNFGEIFDTAGLLDAIEKVSSKVRKQVAGLGGKVQVFVRADQEAFERAMKDLSSDFDGTARRVILSSERTAEDRAVLEVLRTMAGKELHKVMRRVLAGDLEAMDQLPRQLAMSAELESLSRTLPTTLNKDIDAAFKGTSVGAHRDFNEMAVEMMSRMRQFVPDWDAVDLAYRLNAMTKSSQFRRFTQQSSRPGYFDAFLEYWLNAILSGFDTIGRNGLTSSFYLMAQLPTRTLAAGIGVVDRGLFGGSGGVRFGEVYHQAMGMVNGFMTAAGPFMRNIYRSATFRDPKLSSKLQKFDLSEHGVIKGANYPGAVKAMNKILTFPFQGAIDFSTPIGLAIDGLGRGVRTVQNAIASIDEMTRTVAFESERRALAYRKAADSNLPPEAQAKMMEDMFDHVPPKMSAEAKMFSDQMAFVEELTGTPALLEEFLRHVPGFRVFEPFLRTNVSLFRAFMDNSPFAAVDGTMGFIGKKFGTGRALSNGSRTSRALEKGGADRHIAIARMMLGSMTAMSAWQLYSEGKITGRSSKNKGMRNVQNANGFQATSFRFDGDGWVANLIRPEHDKTKNDVYLSYKALEPYSKTLEATVSALEAIPHIQDSSRREDAFKGLAESLGSTIMDSNYSHGMLDALSVLNTGNGAEYFASKLSGSLVPKGVKQLNQMFDRRRKDIKAAGEDPFSDEWLILNRMLAPITATLPGVEDENIGLFNVFGEPGFYPPSFVGNFLQIMPVSVDKDIPFLAEMERQGVGIEAPDRLLSVKSSSGEPISIGLTPQEYSDYQAFTGTYIDGNGRSFREAIAAEFNNAQFIINEDKVGPGTYRHIALKAAIETFRKEAALAFVSELNPNPGQGIELQLRADDQALFKENRQGVLPDLTGVLNPERLVQ